MKKQNRDLVQKSVEELQKEAKTLRDDMAKLHVESRVKPEKDTNSSRKKQKRLAVVLTLINTKK